MYIRVLPWYTTQVRNFNWIHFVLLLGWFSRERTLQSLSHTSFIIIIIIIKPSIFIGSQSIDRVLGYVRKASGWKIYLQQSRPTSLAYSKEIQVGKPSSDCGYTSEAHFTSDENPSIPAHIFTANLNNNAISLSEERMGPSYTCNTLEKENERKEEEIL